MGLQLGQCEEPGCEVFRSPISEWRCSQHARVDPVPMILTCPTCKARHVDVGEFAIKPHHTHACQNCGMVWRPAIVPTVGVQFLPGFKSDAMFDRGK
jgi:hypothetical protein